MSGEMWGRKWRVLVIDGDIAIDVSRLKCAFRIEKSLKVPNYSEVSIWNTSDLIEEAIIERGMRVVVEAGYDNGPYGVILDTSVSQPLWDKRDGVDYVITLHCIDGYDVLMQNFVNKTVRIPQDGVDMVRDMAKSARNAFSVGRVSPTASTAKLPRGKVFFGEPKDYLRAFARESGQEILIEGDEVSMGRPSDQSSVTDAVVLSPATGLVGTPQQARISMPQYVSAGIMLRCLLNPRIKVQMPLQLIKIDNAVIRQEKMRQGSQILKFDRDGLYKVIAVTYVGDTRGNDWYCDITAVNSDAQGLSPEMIEDGSEDAR